MSEKRTMEGSSRTLLLFFLSILLSGRSGSEPPAAKDFVTFAKSNAKALPTAGAYQKYPCALPGAGKARRTYTPAIGIVFFVLIRRDFPRCGET